MSTDAPRRAFLRTCLGDAEAPQAHVTSLLLQVLPRERAAVRARLDTRADLSLTEAGNRIVVVAELPDEHALTALMDELSALPGVLSVALVYHQVEDRSALDEEVPDAAHPA
jgi:nitrate reductase NapD